MWSETISKSTSNTNIIIILTTILVILILLSLLTVLFLLSLHLGARWDKVLARCTACTNTQERYLQGFFEWKGRGAEGREVARLAQQDHQMDRVLLSQG